MQDDRTVILNCQESFQINESNDDVSLHLNVPQITSPPTLLLLKASEVKKTKLYPLKQKRLFFIYPTLHYYELISTTAR